MPPMHSQVACIYKKGKRSMIAYKKEDIVYESLNGFADLVAGSPAVLVVLVAGSPAVSVVP